MESARLDGLGHPVGLLVVLEQALLDLLHVDEPRGHGLVDEGLVRAPAERVRVLQLRPVDQAAALLKVLDDRRLRV